MSGRKEISADYKAQRSSRPDLLKQQWPHLEPLVEAFGYPNVSVEGYEADDVIAVDHRARARRSGIPVMVVTGDRDAYQLVDDGVRIMTTSRGITDTKVYDRQGVIDRYGIPPELVPDFIGLKGDTSRQHPRRPGDRRQDRRRAAAALRLARGACSATSTRSRGAKRKQNLTEHAEDARISKQLATMVRDVPVELDLQAELVARARPLDGCATIVPRVRAARPAAAARGGARRRRVGRDPAARGRRPRAPSRVRKGGRRGRRAADRRRARGRRRRARGPRGRAVRARRRAGASAPTRAARTRWPATVATRPSWSRRSATGRSIAHDAKALGEVPPNLVFDTEVAAYLLEPGAARLPARRAVRGARHGRRGRRPAGRADAVLVHELAGVAARADARARAWSDLLRRHRAAARRASCARCEKAGMKLDTARLEQIAPASRAEADELEREIWDLAGEEFMIGSPQQLGGGAVRRSSACRASAAARPASRPTRACCRRSATSTRSSRRSSAGAS